MKDSIKKYWSLLVTIIGLLILICFALLVIPESQMPTILQSSGLVAIISAFLGVVMTVAVTAILLDKQAETQRELLREQSDRESQKDKDVKIHEQKIKIYSGFSNQMWGILDDDKISEEELIKLRKICFKELVFYLDNEQIKNISEQIHRLTADNSMKAIDAMGKITSILQQNIDSKTNTDSQELKNLYNSFVKDADIKEDKQENPIIDNAHLSKKDITFWHFNTLGEEQIKAFKDGNWVLSLIEYGEDWRTAQLKQVKPDDVIFLFKKGGTGYIGAFKVLNPPNKILEAKKTYSDTEYEKYDIYDGLDDGASLASNILVEPIAYNFKGVGYWTVRRRTIERINDPEGAVKYLLNGFRGIFEGDNKEDLERRYTEGNGKLDENTELKNIDKSYFNNIVKQILMC